MIDAAVGYLEAMFGDDAVDPLTWGNVAVAAALLAITVMVSWVLRLKLEGQIIVAGIRCSVQLTLLGLVLKRVFATTSPIVALGMAGVLGGLAALEVSEWKARRTVRGMFWITFVTITGSAIFVGLIGAGYAMNFDLPFVAFRFIPVVGMLYGNTIVGVSLGIDTVLSSIDLRREMVETMLCYGASRWEAMRLVAVDAVRMAMLPSITTMSITGLISIPGMMSGQILGGADVMDASRYQQAVVFMISATVALSVLTSVIAVTSIVVDSQPQIRAERIINRSSSSSGTKGGGGLHTSYSTRSCRSMVRMKAWKAVDRSYT